MKSPHISALIVGALTGLIVSLVLLLYFGGTGGIPSVNAVTEGTGVIPVFSPATSSLWVMVILASSLGGLIAAVATRVVVRIVDPDAHSAPLAIIAPLGIVAAPVIGMAVFALGIVAVGSIEEGSATVSVVEMVLLASVAGIVVGGLVVLLSAILARPPIAPDDTTLHRDTIDRSA